ncbi:MAG: GIY-YIG nuclease family protein [Candidatus Muirbacterium halophilum]|nr:GIY-YIG nuclease family protein [Candidatus Muirbacterium halophilum]MCK9475810.1 GIY-YIG nuclease family protein [Candidatus Muirbacterium halophilum]
MDEKNYYIYILTNFQNNIFYVGVTSDLIKRVFQHKNKLVKGFTEKYNVYKLVYFELHSDINEAILVEKRLKKWKREFKIKLIEKLNPEWNDLYNEIIRF